MSWQWPATVVLLLVMLPLLRSPHREADYFPLLLFFTAVYYALAGPIYWLWAQDGYFAGVNWSDTLPTAAFVFAASVLGYLLSYRVCLRLLKFKGTRATVGYPVRVPAINHLFLALGLASATFVFLNSQSQGAFFLIAYQFSDLCIPALVIGIATSRRSRLYWACVVAFSAYAVFAGFRYKLILLWFPLWLIFVVHSRRWGKFAILALPPLAGVAAFAVISVARSKFSGLDLSGLSDVDPLFAVYALFSESNIIFGLSSILDKVLPSGNFVYLQPLLDVFLELVPRAVIGDRETGRQIYMVLEGLETLEGFNSATTYPFFGEYLLMAGWAALPIGVFLAGTAAATAVRAMAKAAKNYELSVAGSGLVAVLFAYYYVSRGYLPQFTKGIVFVLIPYLVSMRFAQRKVLNWKISR